MKTGRRAVLKGMLGAMVASALPVLPARSDGGLSLYLDFGGTTPAPAAGYQRALTTHTYTATRGWGWVSNANLASRDRGGPASILRDFIFATPARVFRISNLTPGRYRLSVVVGDWTFGDHVTRITVPGIDGTVAKPTVAPGLGEFATQTLTFVVPAGKTSVDITFDTTGANWVVNALVLQAVTAPEVARATVVVAPFVSKWGPLLTTADPTVALLQGHKDRVASDKVKSFDPTGLDRSDYLKLIGSEVDFWKTKQNTTTGAIIDPYLNAEFQYSTPAFALAAAALVVYAGRTDLLEAAALALDWSTSTLSQRKAASGHEDFFAPMSAHAIRLLKPLVPAERSAQWEYNIWFFEPFFIYRYNPGVNNWNVVAACGEALFQMMGIRDPNHQWAAASFAAQGPHFSNSYGLYLEGPMAYDHFPRLWINDLLARGYQGAYRQELAEAMRRAAITSLFMQSPWGELPAGGRSAHHQWNEAQQCVTYEVYAAQALTNGDTDLAAYFKRAARLALKSMRRWVRPTGEMQIVKNFMDPADEFGYETYSAHSQYNLLPMAMLAMAYEHADASESVDEQPAPADQGGYVLQVSELHKVFANSSGNYVEIETAGDHHYDATGLIRAHFGSNSPQLGPSDSVLAASSYVVPSKGQAPPTTGIGVAWQGSDGAWNYLGALDPAVVQGVSVQTSQAATDQVAFSVRYEGNLGGGATAVEERFVLTPDAIQVTSLVPGFNGPVRRVIPILADDGRSKSKIQIHKEEIRLWMNGQYGTNKQIFELVDAPSVKIPKTQYANHNGYVCLATADYPEGTGNTGMTLKISTQGGRGENFNDGDDDGDED